jgi:hypothetical protein
LQRLGQVRRPDIGCAGQVGDGAGQPDEVAFAAAWAAGRSMTLEQAIIYALEGSEVNSIGSVRVASSP